METGSLPPRWSEYARRLPCSLEDLKGPAAGKVELPLHVAWSGRRVYDVEDSSQRLALYALLLAEAQREDLERFLHQGIAGQHVAPVAAVAGAARTPGVGAAVARHGLPGEPGRSAS